MASQCGHRGLEGSGARARLIAAGLVALCAAAVPALCAAQQDPASRPRQDAEAAESASPLEAVRGIFDRLFGPRPQATQAKPGEAPGAPVPDAAAPPPSKAPDAPSGTVSQSSAPSPGPVPAAVAAPVAAPAQEVPAPPGTASTATTGGEQAQAAAAAPAPPARAGIALILPTKSAQFARAADMARQGFMAARAAAADKPEVRVFETDGSAEGARAAVAQATQANVAVIVGPLAKVEVTGVAAVPLAVPTLVLNTPDGDGALPRNMFALALNIEAEARSAAAAIFGPDAGSAVVVSTPAPLARRAAAAFADAWTRLGGNVRETVEFAGSIARVRQAVERARGDVVFLAADAERARLLRPYLGRNAQVVATSQVFAGAPRNETQRSHDLNGLRFFDMPWLHQPDHPAAMVYARPEAALSPDLERLYALGIDAFRVAGELARARTEFSLDGVTGALSMRAGVIQRTLLQVEYRDGVAAPLAAR